MSSPADRPAFPRRRFVGLAAGGLSAAAISACSDDSDDPTGTGAESTSTPSGATASTAPSVPEVALREDPFALGVASGDPLPDRLVIWTRLVDPRGEPLPDEVPVRWMVANDPDMDDVIVEGTAIARPDSGHSVHVDAAGLRAGGEVWYRFEAGGHTSGVGHARLPVAPEESTERVRLAVASCEAYQSGLFTAHRDIAESELDAVLFLGDFIYELEASLEVRPHGMEQPTTLEEYRTFYATNLGDADLLAARAAHAWIVTWDDHEVEDNYAALRSGAIGREFDTTIDGGFPARRAAAYQAWWEHQPVRADPPDSDGTRIHRDLAFGDLAQLAVLDNRQYRTAIPEGEGDGALPRPFGGGPQLPEAFDPEATMLGAEQEEWLADVLAPDCSGRWRNVAQQTIHPQMNRRPDREGGGFSMDGWDGYVAARQRLIDDVAGADGDLVFVGGDLHTAVVTDIHRDPTDMTTPVVATEFVGPSVSAIEIIQPEALAGARGQPHVHLYDPEHRGWLLLDITPARIAATFRQVDATVADAPSGDGTRWEVLHGRPGATPVG